MQHCTLSSVTYACTYGWAKIGEMSQKNMLERPNQQTPKPKKPKKPSGLSVANSPRTTKNLTGELPVAQFCREIHCPACVVPVVDYM